MQDYQQLRVWKAAHALALQVYRISGGFPVAEKFGLTSQVRRASSSVALNIAEGCGRETAADTAHFLQIALGSAFETEACLLLARDLEMISGEAYNSLQVNSTALKRMLMALVTKVRGRSFG